jgi:hypothetical protein
MTAFFHVTLKQTIFNMTLSISHPFSTLQYLSSASIRLAPLILDEPWLLNDCPAKASEVSDPSTATGRERSKH